MDCANEIEHYQCRRCNFQTTFLTFMRQHWKNNCDFKIPKEVIYKCTNCNFLTYSRYLMVRHGFYSKCATTDDERKTLFLCYRVDNTEYNLYNTDATSLDIQLIPTEFPRTEQFESKFKDNTRKSEKNKNNLKLSNQDNRLQCEKCSSKFTNQRNLKAHVKYSHSNPEDLHWFKCEQCQRKFKHKKTLKDHIMSRHSRPDEIPRFECDQCPSEFRHKNGLRKHMKYSHTKPEDIQWFECDQCSTKFKRMETLNKHKRSVHVNVEDIQWFECEHCQRKLKYKHSLISHIKCFHWDK